MEHVRSGSSRAISKASIDSLSTFGTKIKDPEQERRRELEYNIFHDSVSIGADFTFATDGATLQPENYSALYDSGLATYSVADVLTVFDDWSEFQDFVRQDYSDELWRKWEDKKAILKEIGKASLPPELFKKVVKSTVNKGWGELSEESVPAEELITRYFRLRLAKQILGGKAEPTRILSIVIGMDVTSGRLHQTSFASEVTKVDQALKVADVELSALNLGIFDYVYPEVNKAYMKQVSQNGQYKPKKSTSNSEHTETLYDLNSGSLLIGLGSTAIEAYLMKTGSYSSDLIPLSDALTSPAVGVNFAHQRAYSHKGLAESDYITYVNWLQGSLATGIVTARLLRRANHLGFGPGPEQISSRFGSLIDLYEKAGLQTKNAKHRFDDLTHEDIIEYLRNAAAENGGKLSAPYLWKRINEQGKVEPTPTWLKRKYGTLTEIFGAAGVRAINKPLGAQDCLDIGLDYYSKTGVVLSSRIIDGDPSLPSRFPFYKNFGSIQSYEESLKAYIDSLAA